MCVSFYVMKCQNKLKLLILFLFLCSFLSGCASWTDTYKRLAIYQKLGWMPVVSNDTADLSGFISLQDVMQADNYIKVLIDENGLPDYVLHERGEGPFMVSLAYLNQEAIYRHRIDGGKPLEKKHYSAYIGFGFLSSDLVKKFSTYSAKKTQEQSSLVVFNNIAEERPVANSSATPSKPQKRRLALVIGNADYQETSPLRNPLNDARDMIKILRNLNFHVVEVLNGSKIQMIEAMDNFRKQLDQAEVGLFYYSGHGIQYNGNNYLIPLKAKIANPADLEQESVDVRRILVRMEQAKIPLSIIILDACRNNPYKNSYGFRSYGGESGLTQISGLSTSSTLIAYATQPDNVAEDGVGRNGTYTKHLLRYLQQPGLFLPELFSEVGRSVSQETNGKQQPWVSFSVLPSFCFIGCDMVR